MSETNSTIVVVLRWLAVLPGALVAGSLVRAIVRALNTLTVPFPDSLLGQFGIGCLMGVSFAAVFVFSGAYIAPSRKNAAGLVLAVLFLLLTGLWAFGMILGLPTSEQITDPMALGELVSSSIVGISMLVMAWRGENIIENSIDNLF